ncbi:hypothetical protein DL96DRAFT_1618139 [Flagelloscypha sp. PMI_526]|nr:hypothetical protein DL96DRAFT_1618139 [Flagelloscypha sp. PMI_526]
MAAVASRTFYTPGSSSRGYGGGGGQNPGWEEEVVPALRKRLESESRTLSHRMSLTTEDQEQHDLGRSVRGPMLTSNGSAPLLSASALRNEPSHSSINMPPPVQRILTTEPPPFPHSNHARRASTSSVASTASSSHQQMPFEHWYRGDTSRNGGVGELRVGKRQEMLDIANYGHTLEQRKAREAEVAEGKRRRAGSVNGLDRNSFYMDENASGSQVADEELPEDDDWDANRVDPTYYDEDSIAMGAPEPSSASQDRTTTPTPAAVRAQFPRAGSEPPPASSQSPKQNGRSPNPNKAVTVNGRDPRKNTRLAASQATRQRVESMRRMEKENQDRRSVAMYELDPDITPESIPQFTSHSPANGKWDDVILPAVARKKGLTLSPPLPPHNPDEPATAAAPVPLQHPDEPSSTIIGSSLQGRHLQGYEMAEFGQPRQYAKNPHDSVLIPTMRQQNQAQPTADAPFAEYAPSGPLPEPRLQQSQQPQQLPRPMTVFQPPGTDVEKGDKGEKAKERDGCCCAIM